MTISEVANLLNIDQSTVRFYERKGLIAPARREDSKYRDYSDEDVMKLKRIMLYRKLDFSIDDIQSLLSGDADVREMLLDRKQKLEELKEQLMGSLALCEKMLVDDAGEDLEVDYYLSYVHEEEENGQTFPEIVPTLDRITDNMYLERYLGLPFVRLILQYSITRRIIAVLVFGVLVVLPVIIIARSIMAIAGGSGSYGRLIFACIYGIVMISAFVGLTRKDREVF